jgi:Vacuolar sorting protein 39 domain 2
MFSYQIPSDYLPILQIIPQMPATWSLDLVSSFLSRSFRRSLHEVYEGQILKQLSAGQNLQVRHFTLSFPGYLPVYLIDLRTGIRGILCRWGNDRRVQWRRAG